ncbi:integrase catalytic subunit [Caballeronia arvi]|uniref:Integrase catalytic subunit n=1 Tax=Caballeronia arvi TaxID=1777135 RepID=A0A158KK28_9BURK|nr:integrase catalytic subunit [Caballeronia arvi]
MFSALRPPAVGLVAAPPSAQPRGELRRQLIACLRHGHNTRMSRTRGTDRRGQIPDMVSIHVRPPEIEDRLLPGHWEGDFIKGAGNQSSVGVLVERTSRLVLLAKMDDATAASALTGFSAKLNSIPEPLRQSFTYDQGKELTCHQELAAATGVGVYFCDPHSPWQRGTCENTNGLLRQYLPKGTDLSVYTQDELDAIADSLNNRPRATHAFHSPFEVFAATLASASQPFARKAFAGGLCSRCWTGSGHLSRYRTHLGGCLRPTPPSTYRMKPFTRLSNSA